MSPIRVSNVLASSRMRSMLLAASQAESFASRPCEKEQFFPSNFNASPVTSIWW
ncbi:MULTISPECIES: hypothetical protein [unclassified Variovorax]|uniref:hypothetical protein n=1 Tax=unclassified Variovorax TaxID=663243 RepID=UPI0015A508E3|nr:MULTISPECIES: hypothetical protein [unclassified Variovorax]